MPGNDGESQAVDIEGRRLVLRNLNKVLYPVTGTTKAEVLAYYAAVASRMLPHVAGRPMTRVRWPDGVQGPSFFEKNLPRGTPTWVHRVTLPVPGSAGARETIDYPIVDGLPALIWLANLAALELHVPQWQVDATRPPCPDRLVIDLDPGPPAGLAECVAVAHAVRERLAADGLDCVPVTSGGKGLQLYAPISGEQDASVVHDYARRLADALVRDRHPLVVSRMTKSVRSGKVLLDWSQNHPAKTTIAPFSLRGGSQPFVAAPRAWAELSESDLRQLDCAAVLARLDSADDPLLPLLTPGPFLPQDDAGQDHAGEDHAGQDDAGQVHPGG